MPNIISNVRNLCSPALIYLIVAIVLLIESLIYNDDHSTIYDQNKKNNTHIMNIIIGILIIILMTVIMNKLCASGYNKLAWSILIFYIFIYGFHGSIGFSLAI